MSNKNKFNVKEKSDNFNKIEIKEIKEERKEFQKYSIEDIDKYFDSINENKILGWEDKFQLSQFKSFLSKINYI